jgi:general secretion pathway protein K
MAMVGRSHFSRERGMVLIIVLWVITLLSVMAGSFAYSMRTATRLVTYGVEQAQARTLAEAGIAYAMLHILADSQQASGARAWPVDGSVQEWQFGPGQLRIAIVDAAGLIDLNHAERSLLSGLLNSAGVEGEPLERLLDAIEDWRDPDDLKHVNGAEAEDYLAAGRSAGPKNAPFDGVAELQQVLGMTPAIYQRIAKGLTVYSRQSGIDPSVAPAALLRVLPGIDSRTVEDYLQLRAANALQGLPPPPWPGSGLDLSRASGQAYHVAVAARLATGITVYLEAVVSPSNSSRYAYRLRAWHEGRSGLFPES